MTYFPHPQLARAASPAVRAFAAAQQTFNRDILWNQPVFKAPSLANPFAPARLDWGQTPGFAKRSNGAALDPLPLTATRITQRSAQR